MRHREKRRRSPHPTIFVIVLAVCVAAVWSCGMDPGAHSGSSAALPRFKSLPIPYKIASLVPEEYRGDVLAAFEEWNRATGRDVFVYAGLKHLEADQLSPDYTVGENVVLATDRSGAIMLDGSPAAEGDGPLARTYLKGLTSIRDADIYLFEFNLNFVTGRPGTGDVYSVKSVVIHEAGHILFGPDHSDDPESIMTPQLYPRGHELEKLSPAESDICRFREVYGSD